MVLPLLAALNPEQVSAVVIDDAPIDYRNMVLGCKMLVGNYVKGSIYLNEDELNRYECIPHMTSDYTAAFLLGVNIWYGAVLRADEGALILGENSNVQDNAVLHCDPGGQVVLGKNVTVGHSALIPGHFSTKGEHHC